MFKKIDTKGYGVKNASSYDTFGGDTCYIGVEKSALIQDEKLTLKGVVNYDGKELVQFSPFISDVIKVDKNTFVVEREYKPNESDTDLFDDTYIYELYRVIDGKAVLLTTSHHDIELVNNGTVAITTSGRWAKDGKATNFVTILFDLYKSEAIKRFDGGYEIINDDTIKIIVNEMLEAEDPEAQEYLYDVKNNKRISDIFHEIDEFNNDGNAKVKVSYSLESSESKYNDEVIGELIGYINDKGKYIGPLYNSLTKTYLDPNDKSFNLESEKLKLRNGLYEIVNSESEMVKRYFRK